MPNSSFDQTGFELIEDFITPQSAKAIMAECDAALLEKSANKGGGIRNADKKFDLINQLAHSDYLHTQASHYLSALSGKPALVRAILFDKTPDNNWLVTWHQDKTIALNCKFSQKGWGPWSVKEGIHHVQPPIETLNNMVTFRIHLDPSTLHNGALKIIPHSHLLGILTQAKITQRIQDERKNGKNTAIKTITAPQYSALVMRPHILHASHKALAPSRRRILHLEYSSAPLPHGADWV